MKKNILYTLFLTLSLLFTACGSKQPNYEIVKPKVKYTPSRKNLKKMVKKLQGSPYVWAEEGPNSFDCSGFTYYMYGSMGIEIPRVAREQAKVGKRIAIRALKYGDLIFFDTNKKHRGRITHVGMYLGNGWFTHASTVKHEVIYSNLNTSRYYKKRLRICRRYLPEMVTKTTLKPWKKTPTIGRVAKQPITKKPHHEKGTFYAQIGSFKGSPNQNLLYTITRHGYKYKIIKFPVKGTSISKLLIGPYKTRTQVRNILPHIKKEIKNTAFIAQIR